MHAARHALRRPAAALGAVLAALSGLACSPGADRPNLVVVVVDTLRADHMSLHGYGRATTPEIDRWAAGGTVFDAAWSPCSWTLPAMSMLFTGEVRVENVRTIGPEQLSLAQRLARAGWSGGAVVSNPLLTAEGGPQDGGGFGRGFEHYEVLRLGGREQRTNGWTADEVVDRGLRWLEQGAGEPFFLWLHLFDPHDPYRPEGGTRFQPFDDPVRRDAFRSALRPEHRELFDDEVYAGIESRIALYDSELLQVDRALGRMFAWLEERGLADETLVVLTADHGEGLWQRAATAGEEEKPHAYFPKLYFDHGVQLYSEQVHVPLVLRGPGVPAGVRTGAPVSLLDVVPTLLGLLDLPDRGAVPLDGRDLFGDPAPDDRRIFSLCTRGTTVTVGGRWRLHEPRAYRVERDGATPELYDLAEDPGELRPLEDPQRVAALQAEIAAFRARHAREGGEPVPDDEALQAAFDALGYTGETDREPGREDGEDGQDASDTGAGG